MAPLKEIIDQLPPELQREVENYIVHLVRKRSPRGKKVGQSWAGAMRKYRDQYTSLELQKKTLEWRGDQPRSMYLVDTNIWLERILDQKRSQEVHDFLERTASENIFISDFAFHSIAIALLRHGLEDALIKFVRELFIEANANLVHLEAEDTNLVLQIIRDFKLDFDDAYQYVCASKLGLIIISFDADFDRTTAGRKTPQEVI